MDTKANIQFITSLDQADADEWNALCGTGYPFLRYEFLAALEASDSVSEQRGWQPQHLLAWEEDELVAAMPLYIKYHSYGEYVFDWAWADAYQRHGLAYYPKLLTAIPFTPATGLRIGLRRGRDNGLLISQIVEKIQQRVEQNGYSSWHLLFPAKEEIAGLINTQLSPRTGCQFHWFNRGYTDFDEFLATFASRKRKNIKRERRRVREQGIELRTFSGTDIDEQQLDLFYRFYQSTYLKRAQRGYLSRHFFGLLRETMPEQLVLVLAYRGGDALAGALCLRGDDCLYGRYWGCVEEVECLHFEACYYQGIEYCIANGLQRFDPGAQGEHKIPRGFKPVETHSFHWIAEPAFRHAIDRFLEQEKQGVACYIEDAAGLLPFKKSR